MALGDVDQDGRLDAILAEASHFVYDETDIIVYRGRGDGSFEAPSFSASILGFVNDIDVRDLNGDGALDVVAAHDAGSLHVLHGDGSLDFMEIQSFERCTTASCRGGERVEMGDLDDDGHLDVITTATRSSSAPHPVAIMVSYGRGDGTFDGGPTIRHGSAEVVIPADFDADGSTDLLVVGGGGTHISTRPCP